MLYASSKYVAVFVFSFLSALQYANSAACPPPKTNTMPVNPTGTGKCTKYMLINARGTGELPGMQSMAYRSVNSQIMREVSGGTVYNVNYAASVTQVSSGGTSDIVKKVTTTLASDPNMCFFLEGYSQGAAAVMFALPKLTSSFHAIRGVSVVGNPLAGVQAMMGGLAEHTKYKCKTLEICAVADPVCLIPKNGGGPMSHVDYIFNPMDHSKIVKFAVKSLTTGISACGSVSKRSGNVTSEEEPHRHGGKSLPRTRRAGLPSIPGLPSITSLLPGGSGGSGDSGGGILPKIPGLGSISGMIPGLGGGGGSPPTGC